MARTSSIKILFSKLRMLMSGYLALLTLLSFIQLPLWHCDGSEKHLHADGRLHAHHHAVNHHNRDDSDETASGVIFIKENRFASPSGFSKISFNAPYPYNLCFGAIFKLQASAPTPISNFEAADHPPDKFYLCHCSLLI